MTIRKTTANDINKLLEIFDYAREYMKANNNPNQWSDGYPSRENIEEDIQKNESYVCLDDDNNIIATFCFFVGIEEKIIMKYTKANGLITINTELYIE